MTVIVDGEYAGRDPRYDIRFAEHLSAIVAFKGFEKCYVSCSDI